MQLLWNGLFPEPDRFFRFYVTPVDITIAEWACCMLPYLFQPPLFLFVIAHFGNMSSQRPLIAVHKHTNGLPSLLIARHRLQGSLGVSEKCSLHSRRDVWCKLVKILDIRIPAWDKLLHRQSTWKRFR